MIFRPSMLSLFVLLLACTFPPLLHAEEKAPANYPDRIVSVSGDITEIIYALGEEASLVGSDTSSYYPPEAAKLPKVGYKRALSAEGILSLQPDMVLLTEEAGPPPVLAQLRAANIPLNIFPATHNLEGVIEKINAVATALGAKAQGLSLIQSIRHQSQQLQQHRKDKTQPLRVMFILQHGGGAPMVAGQHTAADAMIKMAGLKNVVDSYHGYKPLTPEAAVQQAPDILLLTTQGLEESGGTEALLALPALQLTPAGKNQHVIVMDSLELLSFGPRAVEAATKLHHAAYSMTQAN